MSTPRRPRPATEALRCHRVAVASRSLAEALAAWEARALAGEPLSAEETGQVAGLLKLAANVFQGEDTMLNDEQDLSAQVARTAGQAAELAAKRQKSLAAEKARVAAYGRETDKQVRKPQRRPGA